MPEPDKKQLTEEDAVQAFAKAWNRLEPEAFLALLAPDARYASQWVFEELVGAEAIANYLRAKMRTIRNHSVNDPSAAVRVEIGRIRFVQREKGIRLFQCQILEHAALGMMGQLEVV